jgi:hypothetical protein
MSSASLLRSKQVELGLNKFTLRLDLLYPNKRDRERFEHRWSHFYKADKDSSRVFKRKDNNLVYLSESWIPKKLNNRPPLLLLFGNPAPHSVAAGMYFAYEGNRREHRIWRIFRETSLLEWKDSILTTTDNLFHPNELVKEKFFSLDYQSPFRLAMEVYFSIPSPPSDPAWSGVGGLHRLFGKKAISAIEDKEQNRIKEVILNFFSARGGIIAFQKDTYNGVKEAKAPEYSLKAAMEGKLVTTCRFNPKVQVFGVPPTRFLQGKKAKQALKRAISQLQVI